MKTMTKENLYLLHDVVKNHPYWNLGTKYGLKSLQDLCEQMHKLQIELFRFLGVRKDYEWLKNPQIVLVDFCVHDVNHEMWYIKNGWHEVTPNTIIMLQAFLQNMHILLDGKIPEKPIGYTMSSSFLEKRTTAQNDDGTYRCVLYKKENERQGLITYYQNYLDRYAKMMEENPNCKLSYPEYQAKEVELLKSGAKITQYHIFED